MPAYDLTAPYSPKGDQPTAIEQLVRGVNGGERYQTLLGATGTGKTFTMQGTKEQAQWGLIPRSLTKILSDAEEMKSSGWQWTLTVRPPPP